MLKVRCGEVEFQDVRAILFDKDGTLANSLGFLCELGRQRAKAVNDLVPGLEDAILRSFGFSKTSPALNPAGLLAVGTRAENETGIATLIAQMDYDWLDALAIAQTAFTQADRFLPRKAELTPLFPGVLELLETLNSQPFKLGIVSSDSQSNVEDFTKHYHLTPYFNLVLGAQKGLTKPNPQLLEMACTLLKVQPRHTLIIGDAIADIQLARNGNALGSIGVTWGGVQPHQLTNATALIDRPDQIEVIASK